MTAFLILVFTGPTVQIWASTVIDVPANRDSQVGGMENCDTTIVVIIYIYILLLIYYYMIYKTDYEKLCERYISCIICY